LASSLGLTDHETLVLDVHLDRVPRLEGERAVSSQLRRNVDEELVIGSPPGPRWAVHELALSLEHHRAIPVCGHSLGTHIPFRATHGFTIMVAQSLSSLCLDIGIPKGGRRDDLDLTEPLKPSRFPRHPDLRLGCRRLGEGGEVG